MKRYYIVQWCHEKKGWLDLPSLASLKHKEATDGAEEFANTHPGVRTRVIRKPHGWEPPGEEERPIRFFADPSYAIQAARVRTTESGQRHGSFQTKFGYLVLNVVTQELYDTSGVLPGPVTQDILKHEGSET